MGHGKCVGERTLTSMQLKISFLVRVKMESFRWWAGRVKSPTVRPGAEEKASGAKGRMLESKNTVQQVANYKRFVLGQLDVFDQDRAAADHAEFRANFCFQAKFNAGVKSEDTWQVGRCGQCVDCISFLWEFRC